ncbi:MAG: DUF4010 domain-containing protein [Holophaga sp.]|nr:DUF4010 domain-containing protein [Holophaga sp.]
MLPPLIIPFLLTLAISMLIGIGLREYYEGEKKYDTFGTVRTFIFIGLLGFLLYGIPVPARAAYLLGMASLMAFLLVYYNHKVGQHKSPGLIGVLIALLTYAVAPVAINEPHWFLVAVAICILYVLHSKGRIRRFTDRLEAGEVVTACKFLAIAAVVLPLIPAAMPAGGMLGQLFAFLPVSPRQIWMAVVVTTAISYLGYVLQTYLYPRKGLLLTGVIGGLYSSTMATLVLAKQTRHQDDQSAESAAAILLTTPSMYLRILLLVAAFRPVAALRMAGPFAVLSLLVAGYAWWVRRLGTTPVAEEPEVVLQDKNPLELNAAFIFALMFVAVSLVTKAVLVRFHDLGLQLLSFLVGASDIVPFIVSVLQGNLGIGERQIFSAVIISTASNNLMKAIYVFVFGNRRSARLTAYGMGATALLSFLYAACLR